MERVYKRRTHPVLRGLKIVGFVILGVVAAAGFAFLFGYFVMLLWNWLMPTIFGLTTLTFWQAVGLTFLARLVFGGFKHGHDHHRRHPSRKDFFNHRKHDYKREHKCRDWRHFDDFWWDEGERAYNDYMERKKEQEQK